MASGRSRLATAFRDPFDYLASRPVEIAIDAELARRSEPLTGHAMDRLQAVGRVGWQTFA